MGPATKQPALTSPAWSCPCRRPYAATPEKRPHRQHNVHGMSSPQLCCPPHTPATTSASTAGDRPQHPNSARGSDILDAEKGRASSEAGRHSVLRTSDNLVHCHKALIVSYPPPFLLFLQVSLRRWHWGGLAAPCGQAGCLLQEGGFCWAWSQASETRGYGHMRGVQVLPRLSQDPFLSVPSQHLQMERRDLSINNLPDFAESALHFLKDLVWCQLWHPMIDLKKCKCLLYCGW